MNLMWTGSSLGSALGSTPSRQGGGGSGKVSLLPPGLLTSELRGCRRGAGTATLGNEVWRLTPPAREVKELVTSGDFSRAFCLQMAFR